jgi:hypothetical protein
MCLWWWLQLPPLHLHELQRWPLIHPYSLIFEINWGWPHPCLPHSNLGQQTHRILANLVVVRFRPPLAQDAQIQLIYLVYPDSATWLVIVHIEPSLLYSTLRDRQCWKEIRIVPELGQFEEWSATTHLQVMIQIYELFVDIPYYLLLIRMLNSLTTKRKKLKK